jgi:hypothetical protein
MAWMLGFFMVFDGVMTEIGLRNGTLEELNPIMMWFHSVGLLVLVKVILAIVLVWAIPKAVEKHRWSWWGFLICVGVYGVITGMHVDGIFSH